MISTFFAKSWVWLQHLFPACLRKDPPPDREAVMRLMMAVSENDPCLRVLNILLGQHLEESAAVAGSRHTEPAAKLQACERMETFRMLMLELNSLRLEAEEERRKQHSENT